MNRKLLYASVAALVSGALLGCLDAIAPGSPHARGISLRIAPVFGGAAAEGGIPSDVDLIRIVFHHPPAADTTLNIPVTPGQDSIRIEIHLTLNGTGTVDTVGVTFQAIRSGPPETVLYSGVQNYELSPGVSTAATPLVATYVGPGRNIRSISITPTSATFKPGDSLAFGFTAIDSSDATIVGMPVLFDSRNTDVVTVSAAGVAKGVALGTAYVVLTSGARAAVKDSALVTVANVAPPAIALSASAATFTDTALTADPASQAINVTNGGGGVLSGLSVGTIAYGAGATGWLVATLAANTAPTTLTLAAAKGSLAPGTYTATVPVQSASASNTPQNVSVTFVVVAAPTIGLSAATASFSSTLLAADPAPDTISVTAAGGSLTNLTLGPTTYGASQPTGWLTASLSGAAAPAKLILTAAKGSLAAGTYTATVPVQSASAGNSPQNVTVTFQIVAAPLASITVSPNPVTLAVSGTQQFTAVGKDAGGNVVAIAPTWSVVAGGGAITSAGLFTAGTAAGTFTNTVEATSGSISGTASVTVSAGALASITVSPNPVTLTVSGTQQFTAVGKDAGGNVVAIAPTWSVVAGGGAITSAGLFTAGTVAGTFTNTVEATSGSISGTASVTVTTPLVTLTAAPGYEVMQPGDLVTLVAAGKDGSGNPVTPFGLSYTSRSPGVATVNASTGVITAVAAGTAVIVAQAPTATGTTADSTLIVVPAGGSAVVAAIGDGRAFDLAAVSNTVKVRVLVDLRGVPGATLGSYNAQLNWNTAALTYVSSAVVTPGGFVAAPTLNETQTSSGQLRFGSAHPAGSAGAFALIEVTFTAAAAGNSPLTLVLTDLSTTAPGFTQLLPAAVIVSGSATVH